VPFLETVIERLVHDQLVERSVLESHLSQMIHTLSTAQKKLALPRGTKALKRGQPDYFRREMLKVSKIIKGQLSVLLKTSFLVDSREAEEDYLQTLSDVTDNIAGAFQHVVRSNVLMPVMLN
jgi:anion-transporting  ArsA/GET3 family ATPase